MIELKEKIFNGYEMQCTVIPMGADYTVCVHGGSKSHIGSVVMSVPRPSLTGEGRSCTSSVLNGIGHKDEAVARLFAEAIAKEKNGTVVCACGIHVDDITLEQIQEIKSCSEVLLKRVLAQL